jgi:nucleotidyltransferase/DNA polymerase involved in DNA repair
VPSATVSHRSARIGDGKDGAARGVLSFVNNAAAKQGLEIGMSCASALELLASKDLAPSPKPAPLTEARLEHVSATNPAIKIIVMDSISLVKPGDEGHIAVAASHGAVLGSNPEIGVSFPLLASISVDADRGIDDAGVSRLPALDKHGIAGACASAFSARIGDGRSLYENGIISAVNETARSQGAQIGMRVADVAELFASKA